MGGGGENLGGQNLVAGREQDYQDWYQQLMDDVQYGREGTRVPIPLRGMPQGPQMDPKDVPIVPARPSGQLHFDPRYSGQDAHLLAGQPTGQGIDPQQLAMILRRLGYST